MDNDFKLYCPKCKKWFYDWAVISLCPVCRSELLSEKDFTDLERKRYNREKILSEKLNKKGGE